MAYGSDSELRSRAALFKSKGLRRQAAPPGGRKKPLQVSLVALRVRIAELRWELL